MSDDLNWLSATKLSNLFMKLRVSPIEAANACLNQVAKHDGKLNAMSLVDEKITLAMAKASAQRWKKGKPLSALDGVPVLIKDIMLVKGWPTLRGSKTISRNQDWLDDAPAVARLREAGAVFVGMTTTPEFGWKGVTDSPLTGITRNPWNLQKTPGGSSGGSSAALAAGYAPLALGTDGGGSIRIPAGFAGVYGLKPSFGRVPAWPLSPFGTVAHIGPMTRRVKDSALLLNVLSKPDVRDWHSLPYEPVDYAKGLKRGVKGMVFAYSRDMGFDVKVEPEVARLVEKAVKALKSAGAKIVEIDPGFKDPAAIFRTTWWMGVRGAFEKLSPANLDLLEPALREVFEQAKKISVDEVIEATRLRGALGSQMRQFMQDYDALLTPTLPITAFAAGQMQPGDTMNEGKWVNWTPFTYPFNLTQQPAASVPCGIAANGLPVGLQIVGRMFEDHKVLQISAAVEELLKSDELRPPGF
ncbi:amidase [Aestuariivirga litoralis]|uniref:amidase n=1 Tax=Aestuariivirga litoralis TaxID=2650924 RepID=UPI0018C753DD|nr:amidase [Aestuariivirga litoralis]MBG1231048.1 amidase [Aestuariivirga litoralis]